MPEWLINTFDAFVLLYSGLLIGSYIWMVLAAGARHRHRKTYHDEDYTIDEMRKSPYTPFVSIVAPAYNEEKTIITNVESLLSLDYPDYEVIIVNDGSKDSTLQLLVDRFQLVKVPYAYVEKIKTKPFRGVYKTTSDNPVYQRLTVVDKVNGGTKADASNAGINVVSSKYFVCTDVDCILDKYALYRVVWGTMCSGRHVIAVSATMRMSNGCEVKNGQMVQVNPPHSPIPLFQELEYTRSFLVGKTALASINALQNVSGGFGLFDTEVAIKSGGYDGDSFAEDMDLICRMVRYMCDSGEDYQVVQIPETCCWTEGPSSVKVLMRQRIRWARGLLQIFTVHRDMLWNRNYRQFGFFTMPYVFIFEFLAPIIEFTGYLVLISLFFRGEVNTVTMLVVFFAIYSFAQLLTMCIISMDIYIGSGFKRKLDYIWFGIASMLEPIFYHPILVFAAIRGYIKQIFGAQMVWGNMVRKGVNAQPAQKKGGNHA